MQGCIQSNLEKAREIKENRLFSKKSKIFSIWTKVFEILPDIIIVRQTGATLRQKVANTKLKNKTMDWFTK